MTKLNNNRLKRIYRSLVSCDKKDFYSRHQNNASKPDKTAWGLINESRGKSSPSLVDFASRNDRIIILASSVEDIIKSVPAHCTSAIAM